MNPRTLALALAILRISLGVFLLLWALEKFVIPQGTVNIWDGFYGIEIGAAVPYLIGALETLLASRSWWGCGAASRTASACYSTRSPWAPGGSS